jgi:hypothetical protein
LLHIQSGEKVCNNDLADYLQIGPSLLSRMISPLTDSTVLTEQDGFLSISSPAQIDATKARLLSSDKTLLLTSEQIIDH